MRVGRSVWEFKIDPKRFREEIKKTSKKEKKKRDENKSIDNQKKSHKKLCHRLGRQQGFCREEEGRTVWSPEAPREPPRARLDKQLELLKEQRATFYPFKQQGLTS